MGRTREWIKRGFGPENILQAVVSALAGIGLPALIRLLGHVHAFRALADVSLVSLIVLGIGGGLLSLALLILFSSSVPKKAVDDPEGKRQREVIRLRLSTRMHESLPTRWAVRVANHADKITRAYSRMKKEPVIDVDALHPDVDKYISDWERRTKDDLEEYLDTSYITMFENAPEVAADPKCDRWGFSSQRREQWDRINRGREWLREQIKKHQD